jgi:hypothetical protein
MQLSTNFGTEPRAFPGASLTWTVQRKDVDNFYGSMFAKLRLSPEWARSTLNRLGLVATLEAGPSGMLRLVAARPA